ncbi:hypothetical protein KJ966_07175 [bacterium]|nr:hypothetical protein [bacterium]
MKRTVIINDILPFILWFVLLVFSAISLDFFLHQFQLEWIGKYCGIPGLLLLVVSFIYSLRKRRMIEAGSLKFLLSLHIYLSWIGALLIIIHAGIHFNAVLPWSAFFLMLLVVISGLVGEYLLKDARNTLRIKYAHLLEKGYSKEEVEKKVFLDAFAVKTMARWRMVHKPITLIFGALALLHVITIFMFWRWF